MHAAGGIHTALASTSSYTFNLIVYMNTNCGVFMHYVCMVYIDIITLVYIIVHVFTLLSLVPYMYKLAKVHRRRLNMLYDNITLTILINACTYH